MKNVKKIGLLLFIVCIFSISLNAKITLADAESLILDEVLSDDIGDVNVFVLKSMRSGVNNIEISDRQLACPYPQNWFFFIDDHVFANWAHPCRYIFVDAESGKYEIVDETLPPLDMSDFEKISEISYSSQNHLVTDPLATVTNSREPSDHLYAVIINGVYNANTDVNHKRYWNDMSAIYCTITQVYGYKPENIYVHSTDGTVANNHGSLDLDKKNSTIDIEFPATEASIENTFDTLANLASI